MASGVKGGLQNVKASLQSYFHVDMPTLKADDYFAAEDVKWARDQCNAKKLPVFQVCMRARAPKMRKLGLSAHGMGCPCAHC